MQLTQLHVSEQYCPRLIAKFFFARTLVFFHALAPIPSPAHNNLELSSSQTVHDPQCAQVQRAITCRRSRYWG